MTNMNSTSWYLLEEIAQLQPKAFIKVAAVTLSVQKSLKFASFVISDSTGTVQATLYMDKASYEFLNMPEMGTSIIVMGETLQKQIGARKQILFKIKIHSFRIITAQIQIKIFEQAIKCNRERITSRQNNSIVSIKKMIPKRQIEKQIADSIPKIEIKTVILIALYKILQSNPDLNNLEYNVFTIRNHQWGKKFMKSKLLNMYQRMNQLVMQGIKSLINDNLCKNFILPKQPVNDNSKNPTLSTNQTIKFIIHRDFFKKIQVRTFDFIQSRKTKGVLASQLNKLFHEENHIGNPQQYAFGQQLIHHILMKFIEEGRIYKNSDKRIFPNY